MSLFQHKIATTFGMVCILLLLCTESSWDARLSGDDQPVISTGTQSPGSLKSATGDSVKDEYRPVPSTHEFVPKGSWEKKTGQHVTIDFENVDIQVFIRAIGEMTGRNFIIDEHVKGNVSIHSPRKISIDEAYKVFESVLDVHGYAAVPSGDVIKIIPAKDAKEKSIETRLRTERVGSEDKIVTQIVTLTKANPDEMKKILDPLVSRSSVILSYPPTGMLVITDVLSNIKRLLKIIRALDVQGAGEQISVIPIHNAAAQEITKILTGIFQADSAQRKGIAQPIRILADDRTNTIVVMATEYYTMQVKELIRMLDRELPRGEAAIRVYRLQNAIAEDLAKVLMNLPQKGTAKGANGEKQKAPAISKDVQILADKATNTLIINAARDDYKVLEGVIRNLDVSRSMVYLEVAIMEVDVNTNFKLGVEWRAMSSTGSDTAVFGGSGGLGSSTSPGAYSIFSSAAYNSSTGKYAADFPNGFSFGIVSGGITIGGVTFPTIGAALQAVNQGQDIHIISTPQVLTMDNEDAEIKVGRNIPFLTSQQLATGSTLNYSNYEFRDVGIILKVTPHINEDGFVRMKINQEYTQVESQTTTGLPTTLKRTANTTVIVKDDNTVVIGGIIGSSMTNSNYQVPCIGNIPLLGNLFKSASTERQKTNLFVFLTPRIVRTHPQASSIYLEKRSQVEQQNGREGGVINLYEGYLGNGRGQTDRKAQGKSGDTLNSSEK